MERYVTFTELKQNLRQIKRWADEDLVHLLDGGKPAFVLSSLEVRERKMDEARSRATWSVSAQEAVRAGWNDLAKNRVHDGRELLGIRTIPVREIRVTESAAREIALEYQGDELALASAMIADLAERPEVGMTLEYDGHATDTSTLGDEASTADESPSGPQAVRFFCVPPCDVLYASRKEPHELLILGVVRSRCNVAVG